MPRLFARGSDGVVCIHAGADDVVDTPLADLSRVLFHSALEYPAIIAEHAVSVTLPARSGAQAYQTHNLLAHGRPGIPFVLGRIANMGSLPLVGTVPVDGQVTWFGRFVTLGADATHVRLHENTVGSSAYAARTIDLVIYVTDLIL
jgi:hypothetical protein